MRLSALLSALFRLLLLPALIATAYLYLYPGVHRCAFPQPTCLSSQACEPAPFRLLALGDPQLEGDTSLPHPDAPLFPHLRDVSEKAREWEWDGLKTAVGDLVKKDLAKVFNGYRKQLDLAGNDLYLAHIYRSVSWWTQPTHTVVLGDLLGSQWIGDEEFQRRTDRFWDRVFKGTEKVPLSITDAEGAIEALGQDQTWADRIIAVAGNHDIGYAGDIHEHRIQRFEDAFGRVNWDIRFRLDNATSSNALDAPIPELHLIILNSMNLDDPAVRPDLQQQSRDVLDAQLHGSYPVSSSTGTILLTHIPFHKEPGICIDAPYFSHFPDDQGGGIKEQNHLSKHISAHILDGLVKPEMGKSIVLNGHDHEGCDTFHFRPRQQDGDDKGEAAEWEAKHYLSSSAERANESLEGLREITVRSMMGSFSGNAGLLSAWWDGEAGEWRYEYDVCVLGVQHIWWAVHVVDLIVVGLGLAAAVVKVVERSLVPDERKGVGKEKKA